MQYTPNLNLKKPEGSEFFNKQHQNDNMDILDVAYGKVKVLTSTTAPTTATVGVVGQFYLNTTTGISYQCKAVNAAVYTWEPIVNEPIGLIKQYAGTDLGSDWGLCNGSPFNAATYPSLAALPINGHNLKANSLVCNSKKFYTDANTWYDFSGGRTCIDVNGYDIQCGYAYYTSAHRPAIAYALHDSTDAFTTVNLSADSGYMICDIIWDGTYYVAVAYDFANGTSAWKLYYSTTLTNTNWSSYVVPVLQGYVKPLATRQTAPVLQYKNGYYVVAFNYAQSYTAYTCEIAHSTNLLSGWTFTRIAGAVDSVLFQGLYYINNKWVLLYNNSTYTTIYLSYCTTAAPTSFSSLTAITTVPTADMSFMSFKYVDGKWVIMTCANNNTRFLYTTTLAATGWSYTGVVISTATFQDFDFDGVCWIIYGLSNNNVTYFYASATDLITSAFSSVAATSRFSLLNSAMGVTFNSVNCVLYNATEKRWTIVLTGDRSSYNSVVHRILCGCILPLIAPDKSYAYIKLK